MELIGQLAVQSVGHVVSKQLKIFC